MNKKEVETVKEFGEIILKSLKKKNLIKKTAQIPSSKYIS